MPRWKTVLLLIGVTFILLVTMAITIKPNSKAMRSIGYVGNVIRPIQSVLDNISKGVEHTITFIPKMYSMEKENKKLKKKVNTLSRKIDNYKKYKDEIVRLSKILEIKNQYENMKLKAAQIVGRDPGNWFNTFTVNKGSSDGVKKGMPVIGDKGLVGYVMQSGSNWAKVITILDSDCSVPSIVQRTRDSGISSGDDSIINDGYIRMDYIPNDSKIAVKDSIETSGIGNIYPKGLNIGKIVSVHEDSNQLNKYALIKPAVDFSKIEEVMIITNAKGRD